MADTINSPNMNLPVPIVGQDIGPTYAQDINNCLALVDQHSHSAGRGVPVTPDGLSISADLPFGGNNATLLRSARFSSQLTPLTASSPDIGCLYVSGVDLYYNDRSGNQVRITQSGGVAGSPGSISNLTSPASAAYVAGTTTFVWQSDANTPANMDAASYIFRNLSANSFGLTLNPPAAMGSDTSLTLPTIPVSTKIMTMDTSGNMAANYVTDNATLEVSSNTLRVKDLGITTAKLADGAVTNAKLAALNIQTSSSCGDFSTSSPTFVAVTNLSVTITTTGRPVMLFLNGDTSGVNDQDIGTTGSGGGGVMVCSFFRGSSQLNHFNFDVEIPNPMLLPPSIMSYIDTPTAGTYTYTFKVQISNNVARVRNSVLIAYEL